MIHIFICLYVFDYIWIKICTFEFASQDMYLWQLKEDGKLINKQYGHKWKYGDKRWTILDQDEEFSHIKEETESFHAVNSTAREKIDKKWKTRPKINTT